MEWAPPGDAEEEIEITMTLQGTGWMGVGIGHGMANADITILRVVDGVGEITDAIATGYVIPSADASQDVSLVSSSEVDGVTTMTFRKVLDSGDENDVPIGTGETPMMFAWMPDTDVLQPHGANRVQANIDLFMVPNPNGTARNIVSDDDAYRKARLAAYGFHGISMFAMWGLLVPAAVFTVRFFRHLSFYQQFHRWSMMMAATITIPAAGAAIAASQN